MKSILHKTILLLLSVSCVLSSLETEPYYPVFRKYSREFHKVDAFRKLVDVNVTYLSSEFIEALQKKWNPPKSSLDLPENGFLVSVFTPEPQRSDLTDKHLWKIYIEQAGQKIFPSSISSFKDKIWLDLYFPYNNHWTAEYFVKFPKDSIHLPFTLILTSPFVTAQLDWKI